MGSILVTGGAGYIGSHTCVELLDAGYDIVVVDNFCNSKPEVLRRVREISGKELRFYESDLLHRQDIDTVFQENDIEAVVHFAGLKAVGESVQYPLRYYHNNITGTLVLCEAMNEHGVKKLVFSSSATVYGVPEKVPIPEAARLQATNPYGQTKLMIEQLLTDLHTADEDWGIALLRYFNPIGAHASGMIGEDPNGIPNNLMPYISQVAVGRLEQLHIFGDDYDTIDGTGVRDYIHVVDLAQGHLRALEKVMSANGVEAYNLGTGTGHSVLEMVQAFAQASGKTIPYVIAERRPGDIGECFADPTKAETELQWRATRGLSAMCADTWRWQSRNPHGY